MPCCSRRGRCRRRISRSRSRHSRRRRAWACSRHWPGKCRSPCCNCCRFRPWHPRRARHRRLGRRCRSRPRSSCNSLRLRRKSCRRTWASTSRSRPDRCCSFRPLARRKLYRRISSTCRSLGGRTCSLPWPRSWRYRTWHHNYRNLQGNLSTFRRRRQRWPVCKRRPRTWPRIGRSPAGRCCRTPVRPCRRRHRTTPGNYRNLLGNCCTIRRRPWGSRGCKRHHHRWDCHRSPGGNSLEFLRFHRCRCRKRWGKLCCLAPRIGRCTRRRRYCPRRSGSSKGPFGKHNCCSCSRCNRGFAWRCKGRPCTRRNPCCTYCKTLF